MNVFVGCSSREVGNSYYNAVADRIGEFIATNKHALVFGGCKNGLMGRVYQKAKEGKCEIIATQAKAYAKEVEEVEATSVSILDSVNRRKDCFIQNSDVLVFLPGGIGTIDELFASIESKRAGEHNCKIVIINVNNFFDDLLNMLEKIYNEKLADVESKKLYFVTENVEDAIFKIVTKEI